MKFEDIRKYVKAVLTNSFTNKKTIDKLSESEDGNTLLFNGKEIKGDGGAGIYVGKTTPTEENIVLFINTNRNYDDNPIIADEVAFATQGADYGKIRFGIDENGNYGYFKAGADSVTPFSILPVELPNFVLDGTKKITTDYYPGPNTTIEYSYKQLEITTLQQRFFGADFNSSGNPSIQCYINGSGNFGYSLNNTGASWAAISLKIVALGDYVLKMDIANRKLYINGTAYNLSRGTAITKISTQPLSFGGSTVESDTKGNRAIFNYAKIYENNTLVRWYVPVIAKDGKLAFYDKITTGYAEIRSTK